MRVGSLVGQGCHVAAVSPFPVISANPGFSPLQIPQCQIYMLQKLETLSAASQPRPTRDGSKTSEEAGCGTGTETDLIRKCGKREKKKTSPKFSSTGCGLGRVANLLLRKSRKKNRFLKRPSCKWFDYQLG